MYVYRSLHIVGTKISVPLEKPKNTSSHFLALLLFLTNQVFNIMKIKKFLKEDHQIYILQTNALNNKTCESNIDIFLHINITIHQNTHIKICFVLKCTIMQCMHIAQHPFCIYQQFNLAFFANSTLLEILVLKGLNTRLLLIPIIIRTF